MAKHQKKKRKPPQFTYVVRLEAELESRLASALAVAFPNIPRDQMVERRSFTVRS